MQGDDSHAKLTLHSHACLHDTASRTTRHEQQNAQLQLLEEEHWWFCYLRRGAFVMQLLTQQSGQLPA